MLKEILVGIVVLFIIGAIIKFVTKNRSEDFDFEDDNSLMSSLNPFKNRKCCSKVKGGIGI